MPGGEMDRGYDNVGVAMAPLGLGVTERPQVRIETREATTRRVGPKIRGALVLEGERQKVTVEGGADGIEVVRKGGGQADWLCDLWLAERLAAC